MYNLNLNLTESEKKRILSLHNSKNINKTILEQNTGQPVPAITKPGSYKLPGITDQNFNVFIEHPQMSDPIFTTASKDAVNKAIRSNPQQPPSTPQFEFIKGVLELAARKFTKSDEILGTNYDTILTNLYGKLNMQNYPYEKFMDYYFGGLENFKKGMKNLIDNKLKGLQ